MKKRIAVLVLLLPHFLFAQNDLCIIKGKTENTIATTKVYLVDLAMEIIDSAMIKNGEFEIYKNVVAGNILLAKLILEYPDGIRQPDITHPIFLCPGTIYVSMEIPIEKELIIRLKGPALTMDYEEKLLNPVMTLNKTVKDLTKQCNEARKLGHADTIIYNKEIAENLRQCYEVPKKYITDNPTSILSIQALNMMGKGDPTIADPTRKNRLKELQLLFDSLSDSVKNSIAGKNYQKKLLRMI